jgi:ABC-type oligopeptide transport system ATPase subunit
MEEGGELGVTHEPILKKGFKAIFKLSGGYTVRAVDGVDFLIYPERHTGL